MVESVMVERPRGSFCQEENYFASPFSEREQQVLQLRMNGLRSEEIAKALSIGTATVRNHFASANDKVGDFLTKYELLAFGNGDQNPSFLTIITAVRMGWVDVSSLPREPLDLFTPREAIILELLGKAYRSEVLLRKTGFKEGTLGRTMQGIFNKLQIKSQFQAVAWVTRDKMENPGAIQNLGLADLSASRSLV